MKTKMNSFYLTFFYRENELLQRSQTDDDDLAVHEEIRNL